MLFEQNLKGVHHFGFYISSMISSFTYGKIEHYDKNGKYYQVLIFEDQRLVFSCLVENDRENEIRDRDGPEKH